MAVARQPGSQEPSPSASVTRDWREVYSSGLVLTDLLVLGWVVFGAQIAWFGFDVTNVAFRADSGVPAINYSAVSIVLMAAWMWILGIYGSRGYRVLGTGPEEYKLIASASFTLFGIVAIIAFLAAMRNSASS